MRTPLPETIRVLMICTLGSFVSPASHATPPPVEAFGQLPYLRYVQITPDGTHFAAVQERAGEKVLMVYNIYGPPGKNAVGMTFDTKEKIQEEIRYFFWPNDERMIVAMEFPNTRGGTKTLETRMASISKDLKDYRQVPKQQKVRGVKSGGAAALPVQFQDEIIHRLPDDPDHILIAFRQDPRNWDKDAFLMDVATGKLKKVVDGNENVMGYIADQSGEVRLRQLFNKGTRKSGMQIRAPGGRDWTNIFDEADGFDHLTPYRFTQNPDQIYVWNTSGTGRQTIETFDLVKKAIVGTVFSNETYDADSLVEDPINGKTVGTRHIAHGAVIDYFDADFKSVQASAQAAFPGSSAVITSRDRAGEKWIVHTGGQMNPGAYYLYLASQNQFMQIGLVYPRLKDTALRPTKHVSYTARDGLEIHGYLTQPDTPAPHKLVVLPHGGPAARSTASFDFEAQFLASRGYAVFKPNFRGSSGYGTVFENAGDGEWGLKMQDDITDGVNDLIARGLVDREKMCIAGGSYGGYAALMGAIRTPDLFKCAFSFGGVTDLPALLSDKARYMYNDNSFKGLGNLHDDRARLEATSPIRNIDKIQIPILLIHGENDRIVPFEHSWRMHKALKKAGKPVKYILFKDGDHNLSKGANRITYLKALETFLDKHIGD